MAIEVTTADVAIKQALIKVVGLGTGIEPGVPQTDVVKIDAAEANVTYEIELEERDVNNNVLTTATIIFTAPGAPTIAEIRDGLIALAISNTTFARLATAVANSTDEIVLTEIILGEPLNTAVTDDGSGSAISFALLTSPVDGKILWLENDDERIENTIDGDAFAQLLPTSDGQSFGIDETKLDFNSGTGKQDRRVEGPRQMNLSVEIFTRNSKSLRTKDAHDIARDLTNIFANPAAIAITRVAGVVIRDHSPVRRLSSLLGPKWEARAGIDLVISYVVGTLETDTSFVETVSPITEADGTLIIQP